MMDPVAASLALSGKKAARLELLSVMLVQAKINAALSDLVSQLAASRKPPQQALDALLAHNNELLTMLQEMVVEVEG